MPNFKNFSPDEEPKRILTWLYDSCHGLAYTVVRNILGDDTSHEMIEDVVQEGYMRIARNVDSICGEPDARCIAYLKKVMRTTAIDEIRRWSKQYQREHPNLDRIIEPNYSMTPEALYMMQEDAKEKRRRLNLAMNRLTERERALLVGRFRDGLDDKQLSEALEIKERNVRVYISRARHRLAILYGDIVKEEEEQGYT